MRVGLRPLELEARVGGRRVGRRGHGHGRQRTRAGGGAGRVAVATARGGGVLWRCRGALCGGGGGSSSSAGSVGDRDVDAKRRQRQRLSARVVRHGYGTRARTGGGQGFKMGREERGGREASLIPDSVLLVRRRCGGCGPLGRCPGEQRAWDASDRTGNGQRGLVGGLMGGRAGGRVCRCAEMREGRRGRGRRGGVQLDPGAARRGGDAGGGTAGREAWEASGPARRWTTNPGPRRPGAS